jgi:GntR family transcriptional regulator
MATPSKGQPKYMQIAADLRRAISDGEYAPENRLPGENDLMATYQVARETARKALAQLINEGIATPRRGAGVFVREFRPVLRNGIQRLSHSSWPAGKSLWADETEDRDFSTDKIAVAEAEPPRQVALLLELADGERAVVRSRRYVLDGKPVLTARSYLPAKLVSGSPITQPDTGPGGIYARLRDLGRAPTHFREDLRARMPEPGEIAELDLAAGTPVVEIVRTAYAEDGTAVEVNQMVADASAYVFRYDFAVG